MPHMVGGIPSAPHPRLRRCLLTLHGMLWDFYSHGDLRERSFLKSMTTTGIWFQELDSPTIRCDHAPRFSGIVIEGSSAVGMRLAYTVNSETPSAVAT